MTAPAIGENGNLFGPYPATAQEREQRVAAVFGTQGPLKQVTMRAGRHQCPGCRALAGDQCGQPGPGGRRRRRRLPHPSRVAVSLPCAAHEVAAGVLCPDLGDNPMAGACRDRERAAGEDLRMLAAAQVLLSVVREDQQRAEAARVAELHSA